MPKVSIIIPTYNRAKFIRQSIDSVLNQTYKNIELIVVNDGSGDNTSEIVEEYRRQYPGIIKYFYQENKGPSAARNKGIKEAQGEYIAFIDSDDYFLPDFLNKCMTYLISENYDLVIPKAYYRKIWDHGEWKLNLAVREEFPGNINDLYVKLFKQFVGCIKMLIKKSCFQKIGYFDESLSICEDLDIWIRLSKAKLKIGMLNEDTALWVYCIHENSLWHSPEAEKKRLYDYYRVLKKHERCALHSNPSLKPIYAEKFWTIGKDLFKLKGEKYFAMKILLKSQTYELNINRLINSFTKLFYKKYRQYN